MSTTVVTPGQQADLKFDPKDYIRRANEKEHGKTDSAATTAAAVVTPPAEDPKPAAADGEPDEKTEGGRVSRSQRRLLRQLGEAEGRAKTLEELILRRDGAGKPPDIKQETPAAASDPEPKQADFATHDEYSRALTRWEARQETVKVVAKEKGQAEQETALRERVQAMTAKSLEESKEITDWDAAIKEANEDGPEFKASEHPTLMMMIATSDVQAEVLYHFAKNPTALEKMLDLTKSPDEQIRVFHRLEGRVEGMYRKKADAGTKDEKKVETKKEPAVNPDAKKPRPSESIAPTGGSAPGGTVSPTLADGKTLNPAWKEQMNMREGRRR